MVASTYSVDLPTIHRLLRQPWVRVRVLPVSTMANLSKLGTRMNLLSPPNPPADASLERKTPSDWKPNRSSGRFAKGGSGGRPKGSRRRVAVELDRIFAGKAGELAQVAIQLALEGDVTALKLALDRASPAPRGRVITVDGFPCVQSVADVPAAHAFLVAAVAEGRITPEEAGHLAGVLDRYVTAVQAVDHEERLSQIEKSIQESKGA
jgi:hypothetical protein